VGVLDDCSETPLAKQYLFTDDIIKLDKPHVWPTEHNLWKRIYKTKLSNVTHLRGIKSRAVVNQPETRKGVRGGIFWCIDHMMKEFPDAPAVIIIEGDVLFNKDWYNATMRAYNLCKEGKGPNGDRLGLLSAYDRKGRFKNPHKNVWGWRSVKKLHSGNWGCANGIGGVMYLVTREFYKADITNMQKHYKVGLRAGDTSLQGQCGTCGFNIAVTCPSYIQHIGLESLAWPGKGWRYAANFKHPFSFETSTPEGVLYSEDWSGG
jgi:hypothetical protein